MRPHRAAAATVRVCLLLLLPLGAGLLAWRPWPAPRPRAAPPAARPAARLRPLRLPAHPPPAWGPGEDPATGEPVPPGPVGRRPVAVVIDNHPQARPQWGLSRASRVYEALTEGGITRYLAVFGRADAGRVGPVRSIRTQFLDYALELGAALAHVGGNEDALDLIPRLPLRDLNAFRYAGPYRRIPRRRVALEHTMFTSTRALRAAADRAGWAEPPGPAIRAGRPMPLPACPWRARR